MRDCARTVVILRRRWFVLIRRAGTRKPLAALATGIVAFALRIAAITGGWALPHLH